MGGRPYRYLCETGDYAQSPAAAATLALVLEVHDVVDLA
jgi:hypothetical protein